MPNDGKEFIPLTLDEKVELISSQAKDLFEDLKEEYENKLDRLREQLNEMNEFAIKANKVRKFVRETHEEYLPELPSCELDFDY